MKLNFFRRKNNDPKTKDSEAAKSTPGIQDSGISDAVEEPGGTIFLRLFRKFRGGKAAGGNFGAQESKVSGQKPEVQAAITREIPEIEETKVSEQKPKSWARFSGIFTKRGKAETAGEAAIRESEAAEEEPETQAAMAAAEIPEIEETKVSKDKPKFWAKFSGIFTKRGKAETAEEAAIQESEAAEEKPEAQAAIAAGEIPEIEETKISKDKPKFWAKFSGIIRKPGKVKPAEETLIQESEAAEEKPEVQGGIAAGEIPEIEETKVSEEKPKFWAKFSGIFRKPGKAEAAEEPVIPESEAAEEKPEVQEIQTGVEREPSEQAITVLFTKKKPWTLIKKIVVSVSSVLILAALIGGLFYANLSLNPLVPFDPVSQQTHKPITSDLPQPSGSEEIAGPSPTVDPYEILKAQADFSMLEGIINILLIGVDHGDERDLDKWRGKTAWHSDVMIVLSINTNTNKVSLISLPRDTFAKIPGVNGIYKLNASLNCGGGWPKPEGFQKVCEAASWMIGGIPVQYYYAVDFSAVKGLVDAIGGVDFDLDISFEINGRSYKAGMQHMDGQGALDYMRVRKKENIDDPHGETGDLNRINRQKAMLVAIFETLKKTGNISNLPNILGAFEGNLYTNVQIDQTAGLAAYAYKYIDPQIISVYSMDGKYAYYLFDWHFVITNMSNRVKIIKEVYGIDISKDKDIYSMYTRWTHDRAWSLWYNMQTEVALDKSRTLLDQAKKILDDDELIPTDPPAETDPPPTDPPPTDPPPTDPPPTDPPPADPIESSGFSGAASYDGGRKYGPAERQLYETCEAEYAALEKYKENDSSKKRGELIEKFKKDVQALCKALSIKVKDWDEFWKVIYNAKSKKNCNQHYIKNDIYVDFR